MEKHEIYAKLEEIFAELFEKNIKIAEVGEDADLRRDLDMNSIGLLYMAMAIEEKFGVKFDNGDLTGMKTIGDVVGKLTKA